MTRDQRILAIWGGAAAAGCIAAFVVLSMRAGTLEELRAKAETLHRDYTALYPREGVPIEEAKRSAALLREHQEQALKEADDRLVVTLPDEYQVAGVIEASARVRNDIAGLKQKAERQKVTLPPQLPFESGVVADKVGIQLAQVYLYRQVLDLCMDNGVGWIRALKEGGAFRDASGTYAVVTCEFTIEASDTAMAQLLLALRQRHDVKVEPRAPGEPPMPLGGIGIRSLKLAQSQQGREATIVASLITVNNAAWQLPVDGGPVRGASATAPASTTTPPAPTRSRLSGG